MYKVYCFGINMSTKVADSVLIEENGLFPNYWTAYKWSWTWRNKFKGTTKVVRENSRTDKRLQALKDS